MAIILTKILRSWVCVQDVAKIDSSVWSLLQCHTPRKQIFILYPQLTIVETF